MKGLCDFESHCKKNKIKKKSHTKCKKQTNKNFINIITDSKSILQMKAGLLDVVGTDTASMFQFSVHLKVCRPVGNQVESSDL